MTLDISQCLVISVNYFIRSSPLTAFIQFFCSWFRVEKALNYDLAMSYYNSHQLQ